MTDHALKLNKSFAANRQWLQRITPPWIQGLTIFAILTFLMSVWVHRSFQGHWWGPFLHGFQFGVPAALDEQFEIFPTSHTGWDGQFYFFQSNDILALGDASKHIDNPSYRYQRIGSPLMARLVAWCCGQRYVSGLTYLLTQVAAVAIGYGFLAYWLRRCGHSSLWALAWLASDGVFNALAFGMPDPVGDALFIVVAVSVMTKRIWVFLPAALFLPLVREAYALILGLIALATAMGWIGWGNEAGDSPVGRLLKRFIPARLISYITGPFVVNTVETNLSPELNNEPKQSFLAKALLGMYKTQWFEVILTAIPPLVVLGWQFYVTRRFGISPSKAGGTFMLDYPMRGWWEGLKIVVTRNNMLEVCLHFFALALIVYTITTVWNERRKSLFAYFCIPYMLLILCMSVIAWEDYSGYMKAVGTIIIMMLLFMPKSPGFYRYAILLLLIGEGFVMDYRRKSQIMFLPYVESVELADLQSLPEMTGPLNDYGAKVEVLNPDLIIDYRQGRYDGIWNWCHRDLGPNIRVRVTNTSNSIWQPLPKFGNHAIDLSCQWRDADTKKMVHETGRVPIEQQVNPNESLELELPLSYPGPGNYDLHVSMIQEGHVWFYDLCEQYQQRVLLR